VIFCCLLLLLQENRQCIYVDERDIVDNSDVLSSFVWEDQKRKDYSRIFSIYLIIFALHLAMIHVFFSSHSIAIIRYDEKKSNRKKRKKKEKKTRPSRLSCIVVGRLVVTTIRKRPLLFFFFVLFFFSTFLLPAISLASPLACIRSSGQFKCMAKFGQARTIRREKNTSVRINQATIHRMMMNACRAGKQ
jgi:hypothetical protein